MSKPSRGNVAVPGWLLAGGAAVTFGLGYWMARSSRSSAAAVPPSIAPTAGGGPGAGAAAGAGACAGAGTSVKDDSEAVRALLDEQLSRNRRFFGEEGQGNVEKAFVIVVGLGGVGSHAAHMLARSGVAKLRLVDFDQVTLSSLNRHAVATRADVGKPKATVLRDHLLASVPHLDIDARQDLFSEETAPLHISDNPDFVLDCIDDVTTKTALLVYCKKHGIPVIASMGAGAKADPTRIHIGDITDAVKDPLASRMRFFLRKEGIPGGIPTVYSSELASRKLCELEGEAADAPQEFGALENFRVRVLPVLGTTPAIFGNAMAAYVMCELAKQPLEPLAAGIAWQQKSLLQLFSRYSKVEANCGFPTLPFGVEECAFAMRNVWKYRSAVSRETGRMSLVRWDLSKPPAITNLVLVTRKECDELVAAGSGRVFGPEVTARVEARLRQVDEMWDSYA